jgi:hypothetical protein
MLTAQSPGDAPIVDPRRSLDPAAAWELEDELASMQATGDRLLLTTMQCSLGRDRRSLARRSGLITRP